MLKKPDRERVLAEEQWEALSEEALEEAIGGVPSDERTLADDVPMAIDGGDWEASPSALIRALSWKKRSGR